MEAPYSCNPQDPDLKCQVRFDIASADTAYTSVGKRSFVESECQCALSNETTGYCGTVIGTDYYTKAVRALRKVLQESKCHTLDRDNLQAQKDKTCGIGLNNEEWRFAVDQMFNVSYWPYIHNTTTYYCVQSFF